MQFWNKILGYRDFAKLNDIKKDLETKFGSSNPSEKYADASALIFFKTKTQQTWLIATNLALYCILDDTVIDIFHVKWGIKKNELINTSGQIILDLKIEPNYRENSGLINFGLNHKNWLYSKKLYPDSSKLRNDIYELIKAKLG